MGRTWRWSLAVMLTLLPAWTCAEESPAFDPLDLTPRASSAWQEVRVNYHKGTVLPHFVLVAWKSGARVKGRIIQWVRVGTSPSPNDRSELREWRKRSRSLERLLSRNCGRPPTVDGEIAWCTARDEILDPSFARELVALAPMLWELPEQAGKLSVGIVLDGCGFEAQVREGPRMRRISCHDPEFCDEPPCRDAQRVMRVLERLLFPAKPGSR